MTRPFVIAGPNVAKEPISVDEHGRPLPPIKDTRSGSFIACFDCVARPLDKLCCSDCPRSRSWSSSLLPRLAIRED